MKIKLWQFEYEFDKDDAKTVIPVLLLDARAGIHADQQIVALGRSGRVLRALFLPEAIIRGIE